MHRSFAAKRAAQDDTDGQNEALVTAPSSVDLLKRAYAAFNIRDIPGALATMQPDVVWPNGMEGGVVHGHEGVRAYWTRQWGMLDPRVDPVTFEVDGEGKIDVGVHQVVRDLNGKVMVDRMVHHVYTLRTGLIRSMEIREQ